jgi:two-component system C4-dicarboxylate transport response regulator DctD
LVDAAESRIIENALGLCSGNVAQAAELLQTPKKTLYDKLVRLGLSADKFRH